MNEWLDSLSGLLVSSLWLGPLAALAAGLLTSVLPCSLSSVPLVIGYVSQAGAKERGKGLSFKLSLTFALGQTLAFTALGLVAALAGQLMGGLTRWWYLILGVLLLLMALQTWELYTFIPATYLVSKTKRQGYAGAFIAGLLGGLFSSPCSTPVLIALLALVAGGAQPAYALLLLLLYAAGHSALSVAAGTSAGFVTRLMANPRYGRLSLVLRLVLGLLIALMGFYLLYLAF